MSLKARYKRTKIKHKVLVHANKGMQVRAEVQLHIFPPLVLYEMSGLASCPSRFVPQGKKTPNPLGRRLDRSRIIWITWKRKYLLTLSLIKPRIIQPIA